MAKRKTTGKVTGEKKRVIKKIDPPALFNETQAPDKTNRTKTSSEIIEKSEIQSMEISEPKVLYNQLQEIPDIVTKKISAENISHQTEQTVFNKALPIYLQLHKGNIFGIFASAIIAPAKYFRNRAFPDAQTIEEQVLTISNGYIGSHDDSQVLLELVLTSSDYDFIEVNGQIGILRSPLSISRIKSIYVSSAEIKKDILTRSLTGDGGIIPELLFKIDTFANFARIESPQAINSIADDYNEKLTRFDKILGALAFVKNYSILLVNKTNNLSAVSPHFFYMAQTVSKVGEFEREKNERSIQFYRRLFGIDKNVEQKELGWLFERLNESKNFTNLDVDAFGDIILANKQAKGLESRISEQLKNLTDNLKRKQSLGELPDLPDQIKLYINLFGALRIYGNLNTEEKTISRRELPDIVAPNFGEYIFSSLGYYYGYTTLRNFEERVSINDKYFSEYLLNIRSLPLKFELTTLFDYAVIESVFQTVFRSNDSFTDLSFLNSISLRKELVRKPKDLPKNYVFNYSEILGKFNYNIKKKSIAEQAIDSLSSINDKIPVISEVGLFCWRAGVPRNSPTLSEFSSSPDKIRYCVYFNKTDIIDKLKNMTLNANEFLEKLEISIKLQELS
jgi:hypothetical protein